jgi:ATP-binding cassette subfamily B protein
MPGLGGFLRRTWRASVTRRRQLPTLVLALLLGIVFSVGEPLIWKINVEQAIDSARGLAAGDDARGVDFALTIGLSVLGFVVLAIVQWLANLAATARATRLGTAMANDLRVRTFAHLQRLSIDFYARARVGDLVQRVTGDVDAVEAAWTRALPATASHLLVLGAAVTIVGLLEWRFAAVDLIVGVALLAWWRRIAPASDQASVDRQQDAARLAATVEESVGAQPVVKAFGLQALMIERFRAQVETLTRREVTIGFFGGIGGTFAALCLILFFGATMLLSLGLYLTGGLPRGVGPVYIAIGLMLRPIVAAMSGLTQTLPPLQRAAAALERIDDLLAQTPSVADVPGAAPMPRPMRELTLENVGFSYDRERVHLSSVSLAIPVGQTVAVVGPSGSGKTTLVNLLTRMYDPNTGSIKVDGQDLRGATLESLHRQIAVVFQDTFLFDASVRENIRLGRPGATDAEIEEAARQAELHDFVQSLPRGYDTVVGERGVRLSAGQRQRVAIARAFVRQPSILVLDEATAALDPATEAAIVATLRRLAIGRTVVAASHRLEAIAHADRIVVLEGGRVVQEGRHAELLAHDGVYRRLWETQRAVQIDDAGDRASVELSLLRTIPVLDQLDDLLLGKVARRFVTEHLPEGRQVVHQGDPGDRFYVIVRGALAVTHQDDEGEEQQLRVLRDGDYFGEVALLRNVPRTATVRTLTPSTLLSLQRGQFLELLDDAPQMRDSLDRAYVDLTPA